jgi:ribosomal-protein-alanine N-acetyltransferase
LGKPVKFRTMAPDDLDEVMAIECLSYLTPWSRSAFEREVADNMTAEYIVAEASSGSVCGYAGMWILMDEGHITNIAVHPDYRRHGIGTSLLCEMARRALRRGAQKLTLEVRPSNAGAQNLYAGLGFVARGRRKRYYSDTGEDAIIMWLDDITDLAEEADQGGA